MENPKTIWHLCSNRWNSAITEYALSSARALKLRGHRVVMTSLIDSFCERRAASYSIDVQGTASFKIREISSFREMCEKIKPDVIFTYGGPETFLTKFFPTDARIIRFRGQAVPDQMAFPLMHKMSHGHVDLIISPAEWLTERLTKTSRPRAKTVRLGCDETLFKKVSCDRGRDLVVLGRLDPIKGHEKVINIMAELLAIWPSERERPRLHIVGEPANLSVRHLQEFTEKAGLKIGDSVLITARKVKNINELLSSALMGVIPSLDSEVICRVAHEFNLCGAPILVSGAGSLDEALFKGSGESYKGLEGEELTSCFKRAALSAFDEPDEDRERRAEAASLRFSLKTMGRRLDEIISEL